MGLKPANPQTIISTHEVDILLMRFYIFLLSLKNRVYSRPDSNETQSLATTGPTLVVTALERACLGCNQPAQNSTLWSTPAPMSFVSLSLPTNKSLLCSQDIFK